jgi:16S rRNA (cytosine967-C5)-methyltransferase
LSTEPKLFPPTVAGVIEALELSFGKQLYADKVVEKLLRQNKKWGSRDRSFVAEHTYEVVRHWRKLWAIFGKEPQLKRKDLEKLFGIYWLTRGYALPDWPKFDEVRNVDIAARLAELPEDIGITESFPEWFNERATEELGDKWPPIAAALNAPASVVLRVNTLQTSKAELLKTLTEEGVEVVEMAEFQNALRLVGRPKLTNLESFKAGLYEVHDAGSQTIAPFLQAQPGDFVIDACAGAGGKALHLAAEMKNEGIVIAMDVEPYKLGELDKRAARNGATCITTSLIKGNASIKTYQEKADRILLDVPCSGTGVIRRDVDTKWKLQPEHVERNIGIQRDILQRYSQMLKPSGTMVYATCSIFRSENEDQVAWFLDENSSFVLEEEKRLDPSKDNDGFYMARIRKNAD